jgi:hypothetical protein
MGRQAGVVSANLCEVLNAGTKIFEKMMSKSAAARRGGWREPDRDFEITWGSRTAVLAA